MGRGADEFLTAGGVNWDELDGAGSLAFDQSLLKIGTSSRSDLFRNYGVMLSGPGGSASWQSPGPDGVTAFQHFESRSRKARGM